MSEEVKVEESPPAVILPAKSEDKLEIEKEEAEAKEKLEETAPDNEEKEEKKEGGEVAEAKDEVEAKEEKKEDGEEGVKEKEKKKFKIPNVHLKTPKVPDFLRSKSKERKKVS